MLTAIYQVIRFELQRTLLGGRIAMWAMLWVFPIALMAVAVMTSDRVPPIALRSFVCYVLAAQVCCMLGVLLWATPAIQAELEGKTWIYLCLRPNGKLAVLLGKYCIAVGWAGSASLIASWGLAWLCGKEDWIQLAMTLSGLSLLASASYGALYLLIGVAIEKRAMIVALAYTLIVEVVVSLVPATINQLTISYRLRSLLSKWMELDLLRSRTELLIGTESATTNVLILVGYTLALLVVASIALLRREFGSDTEG